MPAIKDPKDPSGANDPADPDPNNPDPNNPDPNKKKDDPPVDPLAKLEAADKDLVTKLIDQKVRESIADIKTKLDGAYSARDDALKKIEEADRKKRTEELAALEAAGKHKEAFDIKIAEANTKYATLEMRNKELEKQVLELTRDASLKDHLRDTRKFRSTKASDMAFQEIRGQLVRNDKGEWVHRSGVSVEDFVGAFIKDEANDFLFEPEINTGLGGNKPGAGGDAANKSLFERSQAEVMRMAAEGRLPKRK